MTIAGDTAVVMTVHDGGPFLAAQVYSILGQRPSPAVVVVVDDDSRDGSRALVRDIARSSPVHIELLTIDGRMYRDRMSRITASLMHGLDIVAEFGIVLLSDQDDEWMPSRLVTQRDLLRRQPNALMIAADGLLIDDHGQAIGGTLRDHFPIPPDWSGMSAAERVRAAIHRPFVTGATCALRRELVMMLAPVPPGWLFDRWATIVAASQDGLLLQDDLVIRYRIHPAQAVGSRAALMGSGRRRWQQILERGASPLRGMSRARDIVHRIRPLAIDDAVMRELSWAAMARAALRPVDADPDRRA